MKSQRPYRPAPPYQKVLDDLERIGNPLDKLSRENLGDLWKLREILAGRVLETIPMAKVQDTFVPARNHSIPVRIYTPLEGNPGRDGLLPGLVYYHGGGWTLGSLAVYDSLCRALTRGSGAVVVSVDYRLAPEHPFPAALEDAHLALWWTVRNAAELAIDPGRLAVAGDSAGGNLATVVALRVRKEGFAVAYQALFYPSTDISRTDYPSYQEYGQGFWLTIKAAETFRDFYLPDARDWRRPEVSPLLIPDEDLRLLPPALVMTAGCDPLRDEGQAYAERLRSVGVPVVYRLEPQMIHAALNLYNSVLYPEASRSVAPVIASLAGIIRQALAEG